MTTPVLYRKRIIPNECILLKDDHLFYQDSDILMTAWSAIRPKPVLDHGFSCYYLNEGFKISKFFDHDGRFMYWYCDIISHEYDYNTNTFIFTDLLADVVIMPDGQVKVMDLDELSFALDNGLLSPASISEALRKVDHLLNLFYTGGLERYFKEFDEHIRQYYTAV